MSHLVKIVLFLILLVGTVVGLQRYGNRDALTVFLCFAIIVPLVYLVVDRFVQKNRLLDAREEALRAELALLKSQIDPHFFFNTLNNLYGLAVAKSDDAPRLILKLSELMRFTIYEGKKDHVLLRDEITYLENYLEIQRIRAKLDKVDIRFEKQVADDLVSVPPLMFIMLVENAIKHGMGSQTGEAFIHISLRADMETVVFEICNNHEAVTGSRPGIGLKNLRRRLVLLFPGRHEYEVEKTESTYRARLKLEL